MMGGGGKMTLRSANPKVYHGTQLPGFLFLGFRFPTTHEYSLAICRLLPALVPYYIRPALEAIALKRTTRIMNTR